jgi:AcrR family transcriptional regulator
MARTRSDIAPRIVDAARARFLREGVDGASLRAIASDAGTSIGMIYYYFKTKDDLFFAVVEATYARLLEDVTRACDPALPPALRIRNVFRRAGALDDHEAQVVRLVVREVLVSSERLTRLIARFQRGHLPIVLAAIMDGVREGSIRADLPPVVVVACAAAVGAVPQFALRHVAPMLGLRGDALADRLVDLLWTGIGARPPGRDRARRLRPSRAAARTSRRARTRAGARGRRPSRARATATARGRGRAPRARRSRRRGRTRGTACRARPARRPAPDR